MGTLEVVQVIFFSVSTLGVVIATANHFWFVRDRNTQALISITNLFRDAHEKLLIAEKTESDTHTNSMDFLNVITIYCHMYNENQLRGKTKRVHEKYVAGMLESFVRHDEFQNMQPAIPRGNQKTEILKFIERNPELFENHRDVLSYFESGIG